MVSLKDEARTVEIDIASGKALCTMVKGFDVSRYLDMFDIQSDVKRGFFKPYGSYYLSPDSLAALPASPPQASATTPRS